MLPTYRVESIWTDNKSTTILIKLKTFEQFDQEKNLQPMYYHICVSGGLIKTSVVKVKHAVSIFIALSNIKKYIL